MGGILNLIHECAYPQDSPARRVEQVLRIERVIDCSSFFTSTSISATIAFIRHPAETSLAPCRRILVSSSFPSESMKVTSATFTTIAQDGSAANTLSQHFSNSLTHCPTSFPSTTKLGAPPSLRIVILSITDSSHASRSRHGRAPQKPVAALARHTPLWSSAPRS